MPRMLEENEKADGRKETIQTAIDLLIDQGWKAPAISEILHELSEEILKDWPRKRENN